MSTITNPADSLSQAELERLERLAEPRPVQARRLRQCGQVSEGRGPGLKQAGPVLERFDGPTLDAANDYS